MTTEPTDQQRAAQWAKDLLEKDDWVILDTETTGLDYQAEVVQIAIIDKTGQALLDTLVKPTRPIPLDAQRIHHITDRMVEAAPTIAGVLHDLLTALSGKEVVIYNADYDTRVLVQSFRAAGVPDDQWITPSRAPSGRELLGVAHFACAMTQYAAYCGEWSDYHGNYRYQKLPYGDHSALGDARATLRVIKRMAGIPTVPIAVGLLDDEYSTYEACYGRFPAADVLAALLADLSGCGRAGALDRQRLAHDWFTRYRRDQGERPLFEKEPKDAHTAA